MRNRLYEYVRYLSEGIGPRLTASDNERRAANYIISQLENWGYTPVIEKFKTPRSPYEVFQFTYLTAFLISLFFFQFNFYLQLFLILIEIFLIYFYYFEFIFIHTPLFKFFKKYDSKNIFVKIPAKKTTDTQNVRIVITAHIDSATASILFLPKFVKYLSTQVKVSFFSLILMLITSIISLYYPLLIFQFILHITGGIFLIGFLITFHSEYIAKPTNGANDNASSAGILLGIAETFSNKKLKDKEVWLVFTGAEEAGCIGIYEFLKKHKSELSKDTYFIVLDCTGIGIPVLIKSEGMLKKYNSAKELLNIFKEAAEKTGIKCQMQNLPVGYTEMEVVNNFGFKVITIGAAPENPEKVPNWHQITDTVKYIESQSLENIYNILVYVIEHIK